MKPMADPIWMRVSSGRYINLATFSPADVALTDIVTALSHIKRCNGHHGRIEPLSVLQHSMLTADLAEHEGVPASLEYACLIHDAHEAYIGDNTTPNKMLMGIVEPPHIKSAVRFALGGYIGPETYHAVKRYDYAALEVERKAQWKPVPEDDQFWPPSYLGIDGDLALKLHRKYLNMGADHFMDRWARLWLSA